MGVFSATGWTSTLCSASPTQICPSCTVTCNCIERAASAASAWVIGGSTANIPLGDGEFWQKALLYHLGPRYRSAEGLEKGAFRGVLFTSKDAKPYSYLVAVRVQGRLLHVFEAFFPGPEALTRRRPPARRPAPRPS